MMGLAWLHHGILFGHWLGPYHLAVHFLLSWLAFTAILVAGLGILH